MTEVTLTGSCLCGSAAFSANGEVRRFFHCHCSRCRKATGTGHASNLFLKGTLSWLSGESKVVQFKLPEAKRFSNTFCQDCGSRMPRFIEEFGVVVIPAGCLDQEPPITPQARIFGDSRAAWSCADGTLPMFAEYAE